MVETRFAAFARWITSFSASLTVQSAIGLGSGGIGLVIGEALGRSPWPYFLAGYFLPIALTYAHDASGWGLRRNVRGLDRLAADGILTATQCEKLKKRTVERFDLLRFGKPRQT